MRTIVDTNPAEHVLRPMRELMLSGYDWGHIGIALAVLAGLALIGIPLTIRRRGFGARPGRELPINRARARA
jgi:hypothetical protein